MSKDDEVVIDRSKLKSKFTHWKPKKRELLVEQDNKIFVIHFEKIFEQPNLHPLDNFIITKSSYINQLPSITRYANFFMNCYDPENDLATAYLKIKYALDKEKAFNETNTEALIDLIYEILFTPRMCEKIIKMVKENYIDDIEKGDDKGKYKKNNKEYLESLEFTNEHIEILLRISFGIKIMSPILFHFLTINNINKLDKDSDLIYRFYKRLFPLFQGNCDMYNKLFVYVKTKVLDSAAHNSRIFEQREIFGIDLFSVINKFIRKVIISENMVKYQFPEHWDAKQKKYKENIIGFNKTIIKFQMHYFLKEQYEKTMTEVSNTKNSDGLSGQDKMEMNLTKIDEGIVTLADINVRNCIERIQREIDVPITEEEIQYYRDNQYPSELQIELVRLYYANYFNNYRDLKLITRREYIILMLLLKKKLLIEAGYDKDNEEFTDSILPYIITGNLEESVNTRLIRNNKFISKLQPNSMYQYLIDKKYRYIQEIKPDVVLSLLSSIINTNFTYVVYEQPDLLGKPIEYNEDRISDELLFFLKNI